MIDKPLLAGITVLLTLSLLMSYSLTVYTTQVFFEVNQLHFFIRQLMAIFIGFSVMVVLSKLDPDKWFVPVGVGLFVLFFILMIVMQFMPASLVKAVGGAKRWISLGPISIAPVEFFKVGFVFFLSWSLTRKFKDKSQMKFREEVMAFSPYLILYLIAVVLIAIFQKDLGQVVVLGGTMLVLFLFVGSSFKFFMTLMVGAVGAFVGLIAVAPHRIDRIISWWGTVQDDFLAFFPFEPLEKLRVETVDQPYQISNGLHAIHNGGFFGQGFGNGQFKLGYLSEIHNDFILAGLSEEMGLVGLLLVVFTILFVVYRIFQIAAKVENPLYYLFSIGVGMLIALAFLLNSYGISGMTPIKGIAVPFLSYGGSHILAMLTAMGMILMISKKVPRDPEGRIL